MASALQSGASPDQSHSLLAGISLLSNGPGTGKLAAILKSNGYELAAQIGKGTYGTVYKCAKLDSDEEFAVKVLDLQVLSLRSGFDDARLMREASVMKKLTHPNLCKLHDVIKASDYVLFILELVRGQDLFDTILARRGISDTDARYLFRQIFSAIGYMHAKGIVHRDLKPENILLHGILTDAAKAAGMIDKATQVKIVDFGLSKEQSQQNTFAGTPRYIAPEILAVGEAEKRRRNGEVTNVSSSYGTAVDCFSVGIVLFVALAGSFPRFERDAEGLDCIKFAQDSRLTAKARALILGLTHPNPVRRVTVQQALVDPWLLESAVTPVPVSVPSIGAALLMQPMPPLEHWPANRKSQGSSGSSTVQSIPSDFTSRLDCDSLNRLRVQVEACFAAGSKHGPLLRAHAGEVKVLMSESVKVLMLLTNTADSVLSVIPDTRFACEEGEPELVASTLGSAKSWISAFQQEARNLKARSDHVVKKVEDVVNESGVDTGPEGILTLLLTHRTFICNLDVSAQFLVQRTEHLEGLVSMTRNAKMRPRFLERLQEYLRDWERLLQCLQGPLFVHLKMTELLADRPLAKVPSVEEGMPIGVYRGGMIRLL